MPYVHVPEDGLSLWYTTSLPGDGSVRYLDRSRPTILLLHGTVLGAAGMIEQLQDPRLADHYNLIAPDLRGSGETHNEPCAARDAWTDAADIMKLLDYFQLTAVHIFAVSCITVHAAQRIPILWPSRCLSLTLVSVPLDEDEKWMSDSLAEIFGMFVTATSLEGMEEAVQELFPYGFGEMERWLPEDKKDAFATYLEIQYNATRNRRMNEFAIAISQRVLLTPDELALINVPLLIINGDDSFVSPPEPAFRLQEDLIHVPGGAKLHILPGAPDLMHFVPQFAKRINSIFVDFLEEVSAHPSVAPVRGESMRTALSTLARIKGDASIAKRDPRLTMSFSCVPPDVREARRQAFARAGEMERNAWSPIGPNGKPPRKYSERYIPQSFYSHAQLSGSRSTMFFIGVDVALQVSVHDDTCNDAECCRKFFW